VHAVGLDGLVTDSVVPDQRIREGDDLTAVGGIGDRLLIAGHGGVEDHLTGGVHVRPDRLPVKAGPVFK
jgi:hypothetical protein